MTSFGWKRKAGESIDKSSRVSFESNSKEDASRQDLDDQGIDWLTLAPKRRVIQLEDALAKSRRLKEEGSTLAGEERFWEALRKWEEGLSLNPDDETIWEMRAQAYMQLSEVLPALKAAEKAVALKPTWWVAYQTLGRAHLGLGEVRLAIRAFCKAIHINPLDDELWKEDLAWAKDLIDKKRQMEEEYINQTVEKSPHIYELDSDIKPDTFKSTEQQQPDKSVVVAAADKLLTLKKKEKESLNNLPKAYIHMRH